MTRSSGASTRRIESGLELDRPRIRVGQIREDDRSRLVRGFTRLGVKSRRRRFFTPIAELSEAELSQLTSVDHRDHEAFVAFDLLTSEANRSDPTRSGATR
jgi:hypothetical protein